MLDIPKEWQFLLTAIQKQDPKAIIAGGCLRDLWCGKPHKDVDIFVFQPVNLEKMGVKSVPEEEINKSYKEQIGVRNIIGASEHDYLGHLINMIWCANDDHTPLQFIESFDFGICQIAWTGTELITSPAFLWDFKYGIFTMTHGRSYEKSKQRYERINQRYDWPMHMSDTALVEAYRAKWKIPEPKQHVSTTA